jgi:hypothetical protein
MMSLGERVWAGVEPGLFCGEVSRRVSGWVFPVVVGVFTTG